ncbi:MAG: MBL fold metallo-hydrolase, partial [Candidatus Micrarchaeota archaeon]
MVEIVFLGSGGGRIVLDRQVLATGGFRINSPHFKMHADPGPGAFLKSLQHKQDPVELNALFCSHAHIDHCNDVNMMIEAMNFGSYDRKKGILLGSESVINGFGKFEKQVDEYFKMMLKECWAMKAGESYEFLDTKKPDASKTHSKPPTIKAMKTSHEDPSCIGFLFE